MASKRIETTKDSKTMIEQPHIQKHDKNLASSFHANIKYMSHSCPTKVIRTSHTKGIRYAWRKGGRQ